MGNNKWTLYQTVSLPSRNTAAQLKHTTWINWRLNMTGRFGKGTFYCIRINKQQPDMGDCHKQWQLVDIPFYILLDDCQEKLPEVTAGLALYCVVQSLAITLLVVLLNVSEVNLKERTLSGVKIQWIMGSRFRNTHQCVHTHTQTDRNSLVSFTVNQLHTNSEFMFYLFANHVSNITLQVSTSKNTSLNIVYFLLWHWALCEHLSEITESITLPNIYIYIYI